MTTKIQSQHFMWDAKKQHLFVKVGCGKWTHATTAGDCCHQHVIKGTLKPTLSQGSPLLMTCRGRLWQLNRPQQEVDKPLRSQLLLLLVNQRVRAMMVVGVLVDKYKRYLQASLKRKKTCGRLGYLYPQPKPLNQLMFRQVFTYLPSPTVLLILILKTQIYCNFSRENTINYKVINSRIHFSM